MAASLAEFNNILRRLCRLSPRGRSAEGPAPCAQLVKDIVAQGDRLAEIHTRVPGVNEYRLNGNQLRLQYKVDFYRDGDQAKVYVVDLRIHGDQVAAYPEFVREAAATLETANGATAADDQVKRVA